MNEVSVAIVEILKDYMPDIEWSDMQYEESLSEKGLDSMTFIMVIIEIEDRFNIEISDEYLLLSEMDSINKMATVVLNAKNNNFAENCEIETGGQIDGELYTEFGSNFEYHSGTFFEANVG